MVKITEELLRKRAEHNEGRLSTLKEVTLHQFEIERIENLQEYCKHLEILFLQNNIINKIENVSKLKKLQYLNLALNNIERIENLSGCEGLSKLDLTVNFIEEYTCVNELETNFNLQDLYLTGNPCTQKYGYREYVVTALPQLKRLDGVEIEKSERIRARQMIGEIKKRLEEEKGNIGSEEEKTKSKYTKEERVKMYRELSERRTDKEEVTAINYNKVEEEKKTKLKDEKVGDFDDWRPDAKKVEIRRNKEGRVLQYNEGEFPFKWTETSDGLNVKLDLTISRFLNTSLIDIDVQPTYIKAVVKTASLVLLTPCEVHPDNSSAQRSKVTGHLVITMKKASTAGWLSIEREKEEEPKIVKKKDQTNRENAERRPYLSGETMKSNVDYAHIITGDSDSEIDESEVPPLE